MMQILCIFVQILRISVLILRIFVKICANKCGLQKCGYASEKVGMAISDSGWLEISNSWFTQAWRRPLDRRTSTQLTVIPPPSNEKSEVDALSASCIEDEEKEEVEALSASCIEDGEEDDMFAIATQEQHGVVDETVDDDTLEKSLDNNTDAEERTNVSSFVPDSMGLLEQETALLNGVFAQ